LAAHAADGVLRGFDLVVGRAAMLAKVVVERADLEQVGVAGQEPECGVAPGFVEALQIRDSQRRSMSASGTPWDRSSRTIAASIAM